MAIRASRPADRRNIRVETVHHRAGILRSSYLPLLLGMVLPVVALVVARQWWSSRSESTDDTIAGWRQQLAALDEARAVAVLQRTAAEGAAPLPALVAALECDRPALVFQASQLLSAQLDEWNSLSPPESESRRCELAELLAAQIAKLPSGGQRTAADLAMRMLTDSGEAEAPSRLLTACERILEVNHERRVPRIAAVESRASVDAPAGAIDAPTLVQPDTPSIPRRNSQQLPVPPLPSMKSPATQSLDPLAAPSNHTAGKSPGSLQPSRDAPQLQPVPASDTARLESSPRSTGGAPPPLAAIPLIDLLQLWHDGPTPGRAGVEQELKRRGISARQIEIGLGLTSPVADQRRRWLEQLPRLAEIDAKPWLLWLSRDESDEVRLTALQMMATANEPAFQRRASEMATGDVSSEIRELAQRISRGAGDKSSLRR